MFSPHTPLDEVPPNTQASCKFHTHRRSPIPRLAPGIMAFAAEYDVFVVDQWGVLHDGCALFPGVREALQALRALGKRVVLLSNSGKPAAINAQRLAAMGLDRGLYSLLITSGEVARTYLITRTAPFVPALGRRCLLLTSTDDATLFEGLDLEQVSSLSEADFILLAGVRDDLPMAHYLALLRQAAVRDLPLVCVNPDTVRFSPQGLTFSAGEVARRYERLGGRVDYLGKPYPSIYRFLAEALPDLDPQRTLAIGDSLFHDILGGAQAGWATALVTSGIYRAEFASLTSDAQRLQRVCALARDHGVLPDWVIPAFTA